MIVKKLNTQNILGFKICWNSGQLPLSIMLPIQIWCITLSVIIIILLQTWKFLKSTWLANLNTSSISANFELLTCKNYSFHWSMLLAIISTKKEHDLSLGYLGQILTCDINIILFKSLKCITQENTLSSILLLGILKWKIIIWTKIVVKLLFKNAIMKKDVSFCSSTQQMLPQDKL